MNYRLDDYGVMPDREYLQTEAIQNVFDLCKESGGTVVFPKGTYLFSGLLLHSHTEVYLESGAILLGSKSCSDYKVFDVPENVQLRTDIEMIPQYFGFKKRDEYRRAMFSAYGEEDITITGEPGSIIDGRNCYDAQGEEGYRGPHGIFLSNCRNIALKGYTIQHSGNFMHQLDACSDITMADVTCLGGSDGIHLHCCENTEIERCVFRTGDDCIAGINIRNLHINNCVLNSSCQAFRIGGVGILAENCHIYGPGYYPHRVTVVKSENDILPREAGRHNLVSMIIFFASETFPANCSDNLQAGDLLKELTFENVRFTGLEKSSRVHGSKEVPLNIRLKNVTAEFLTGSGSLFDPESTDIIITETKSDEVMK